MIRHLVVECAASNPPEKSRHIVGRSRFRIELWLFLCAGAVSIFSSFFRNIGVASFRP